MKNDLAKHNVFTSQIASLLATNFIEERQNIAAQGEEVLTRFEIPALDAYLNPFMAGDLITILGRPQNGKTLLGMYLIDRKLKQLMAGSASNKAVIIVTLEVPVERIALYMMSRLAGINTTSVIRGEINDDELRKLGMSALRVGSMPLFIIGHSTRRTKEGRRARPALTTNNISLGINYIMNEYIDPETDQYIEPELILVDYLQRIHKEKGVERSEHMLQAVDWSKDLALWAGCPTALMVQAGRQVDERLIRIPEMADGQWTSNIEQSSDFSFGAWLAKTAPRSQWEKAMRVLGVPKLPFSENVMFFKALKQKDGPAGKIFPLYVDAPLLKVGELDVEEYR